MKLKNPMGRPSSYRKDFHPQEFIRLSSQGKTLAQIASDWNMWRESVSRWRQRHPDFNHAVKKGRELCEAWYINLGQRAMVGQVMIDGKPAKVNLGFYCWMTKNLFKWTDRVDMNQKIEDTTDNEELKKLTDWLKGLHQIP